MTIEARDRLKWARDCLLNARNRLAVERDRTNHGRSIDIIQIITLVDAASLVCKEVIGEQ